MKNSAAVGSSLQHNAAPDNGAVAHGARVSASYPPFTLVGESLTHGPAASAKSIAFYITRPYSHAEHTAQDTIKEEDAREEAKAEHYQKAVA